MNQNKKKKIIIGSIVLLIAAATTYWSTHRAPKAVYKEFTVKRGYLELTILSTGTVQPENRLEIKAPIAGRIERVLIEEGKHIHKGQILAWMSSTERAALLDAARARGPEELARWEELYKSTPIMAPIAGMIILRNVEPGQTITTSDAIFAMSDRLTVKAQVDETDIAKIKLHQEAEIILDAYPDQEITASVDQIAFEAKTVNNVTTYVVDVLPEETPEFMRAGMTANVKFFRDSKDDVLLLNSEAIQSKDGKSTVTLKATDGGIPAERTIQTGLTDGKRTEILSGLVENDTVVRVDLTKVEKPSGSNPFSPFSSRKPGQGGGGNGGSGRH